MPGTHITRDWICTLAGAKPWRLAAARAGISASTGTRLDADRRLPSQRQKSYGRRRRDRSAAIWDAEIILMRQEAPGLRPVAVFAEMLLRHPDLSANVRRTLERRVRDSQAEHGPERDGGTEGQVIFGPRDNSVPDAPTPMGWAASLKRWAASDWNRGR